jgi:hypothetical protein
MAGSARPVTPQLSERGGWRGAQRHDPADCGIEPYRGLMGALKVRDAVELVIGAKLALD